MRQRKSPSAAAIRANGFVNRRSTVQSRPPAQAAPKAPKSDSEHGPKRSGSVRRGPSDVQRARWILHLVRDVGVPLAAAVAAEARVFAVYGMPAGAGREAMAQSISGDIIRAARQEARRLEDMTEREAQDFLHGDQSAGAA